ncbi:hypothetical protein LCGC14_0987950 [marine sediment metagenome]|uniref:Uncharacterized protein n=1 Tax=marine sediment metagenome TaxID=412755 RepID=A0A0F9N6K0_9ZZZZ
MGRAIGRPSSILSPSIDATSGRSYRQSSQTPGALGGRRAVQRWYTDGVITDVTGQIVQSVGGVWRLLVASARVRVTPSTSLVLDIEAKVPGGSYTSVFDTVLTITAGQLEATGGVLSVGKLYPVGTLFRQSYSSGNGTDLTVELHYKVKAVSQ